jgi:putative intracellular protease/amidase
MTGTPANFTRRKERSNFGKCVIRFDPSKYSYPSNDMKVLIILTSHAKLGNTDKKTGFWLEEFAAPYYVLLDAGVEITLASPAGGQPPLDPKSDVPDAQSKATERFKKDDAAQSALSNTTKLAEVDADGFDAIFYSGGHGPLWDLAEDADSQRIIEAFMAADRPLAAVCHAPAIFKHTKRADGTSVVSGRHVTGFANTEEAGVGLTKIVPFLVEDMLTANGGLYEKGPDWGSHVVVDGNLVTGQNPASSQAAAKALLKLIERRPRG